MFDCGWYRSKSLWNFKNAQKSERVRREGFALSEWQALRARLESRLDEFIDTAREVALLGDKSLAEAEPLWRMMNRVLNFANDRLAVGLQEAQESGYAAVEAEWEIAGEGSLVGGESSWDRILKLLGEVDRAVGRSEEPFADLAEIMPLVKEIEKSVRGSIRTATLAHDPDKIG